MNVTSEKTREGRFVLEKAEVKPEFRGYGTVKRKNKILVKLSLKEYCIYCG